MKQVEVIGMGYMGLPMAILLSRAGFRVMGVDIDRKKVEKLKKGELPFEEPGIEPLFRKIRKNVAFASKPEKADVFIIAVPTPITKDRKIDLVFVKKVAESLVPVLEDGNLVIVESTVSPGSCEFETKKILDRSGKKFLMAYCPERAFPGNTLHEMIHNDRIIGGLTPGAAKGAEAIYSKFVKGKIFLTKIRTAETVKLLENSYRDVNIALANEMARLAHDIGVNIWEVIDLANHHPRVNVHLPGPGVGGHCIPIDPWFLVEAGKDMDFLRDSLLINENMAKFSISLLENKAKKEKIKIKKVGVLGIAYKKNVDDARETPATKIIEVLKNKGYLVKATDPLVKRYDHKLYSLENVLNWSDAIILVTDHDIYGKKELNRNNIKIILDTRNMLSGKFGNKLITLGNGE